MRFDRLRKGAIKSFFTQVAEDLANLDNLQGMRGLVACRTG